ncbi:Uncharacterised protein [Acinetobacter baumannii]|nr:Uncharacterised protein [Acinetobacter baumannii]
MVMKAGKRFRFQKVKLTNGLMTRPIFVIRRSLKVLVSHQNQSRILNRHVFWQCLVTR